MTWSTTRFHTRSPSSLLRATPMLLAWLGSLTGCLKGPPPPSTPSAAQGEGEILSEGTYAKQIIYESQSSAAGLNLKSLTERLLLAKVTGKGNTRVVSSQVCDLRNKTSGGATVTFPPAVIALLGVSEATLKLTSDGSTTKLESPQFVEVLGANLKEPATEAMPENAADPRVMDSDQDGSPGVSVNLKIKVGLLSAGGKIYLAQRSKWTETGTTLSADRASGDVTWEVDQKIFGSDSTILGSITPKVTASPQGNRFSMIKVADDATCDQILKDRESLFGPFKL